jgi:HK97 family phage portal protein
MILEKLIPSRRSNIENPSTPLSSIGDDSVLWNGLTGGDTASSGVSVSTHSGLTYSAVWRGVNLISRDVAKIPLIVYRRVGEGKERATDHPAYKLLKRSPNAYTNQFHFRQTLTAHALFTGRGNGYAYIIRNGAGDPIELLLLNPNSTYPVRYNGVLWYVTEIENAGLRKLNPQDVLHIKGLGYDGLVGYDIVSYMKETLGLGLGIRKFGSVFFKNGASLNVVLERPADAPRLSEEAERNLRDSFDKIHAGLDNAHRTSVLQEGTKASILGIDAQKSQLLELRQFEIREIANFLGLPPHKLGDTTRTAFASLEQENQSYLDDALDGWLCNWEAECTEKLLREDEKENDTHFIEFVREAVVRLDFKTLVEGLVQEVNNGLLCADEARSILNRGPIPDGLGAVYRIPANIQELTKEEEEPEPPVPVVPLIPQEEEPVPPVAPEDDEDPEEEPDEEDVEQDAVRSSLTALLSHTADRMNRRLREQAARAAKKSKGFVRWIEESLPENRDVVLEALSPVVDAMRAAGMTKDSAEGICDRYIDRANESLLEACEVPASELAASIEKWPGVQL